MLHICSSQSQSLHLLQLVQNSIQVVQYKRSLDPAVDRRGGKNTLETLDLLEEIDDDLDRLGITTVKVHSAENKDAPFKIGVMTSSFLYAKCSRFDVVCRTDRRKSRNGRDVARQLKENFPPFRS